MFKQVLKWDAGNFEALENLKELDKKDKEEFFLIKFLKRFTEKS
jgi:hypothetical protein